MIIASSIFLFAPALVDSPVISPQEAIDRLDLVTLKESVLLGDGTYDLGDGDSLVAERFSSMRRVPRVGASLQLFDCVIRSGNHEFPVKASVRDGVVSGAVFQPSGVRFFSDADGEVRWLEESVSLPDCGVVGSSAQGSGHLQGPSPSAGGRQAAGSSIGSSLTSGGSTNLVTSLQCDLALQADYEYFLAKGLSVQDAEELMEEATYYVSSIYEYYVNLRFRVTVLEVWTAEPDPFDPLFENEGQLLFDLRNYLVTRHTGEYRVAYLFTGASYVNGGLASCIGCACTPQSAGLGSQMESLSKRVALMAHELGHQLGAKHCDGEPDCGLMWPAIGKPSLTFGSSTIASISSTISNNTSCFDLIPPGVTPSLAFVSPSSVAAFDTVAQNTVATVLLGGSELDGVHLVHVGAQLVDLSNLEPISSGRLEVELPKPTALGQTVITASAGAPSNGLMFEYTVTDPPRHTVASVAIAGFPISANLGGTPGTTAVFSYALDPTTAQVNGFDVLANPVKSRTLILDAVGLGFIRTLCPNSWQGQTVYCQMVTQDSGGAYFASSISTIQVDP